MSKSSHCQKRCSTSEMNSLESTAPPTRAELLSTSKGLQTPNWTLQHHLLSAWIMFKAAKLQICQQILLPLKACLGKEKGWMLKEHSQVLWEFIKVHYLQNLQALCSNWRCLSTHPSCLKHDTQHILPEENTQWNSSTATLGFWLTTVQ